MKRAVVKKILKFIRKHLFVSFHSIKKAGIIKNHHSLKNLLDLLVKQKKIAYIRFWKRYYVKSFSENLGGLEIIGQQADKTFLQLKNPNLKKGSFYTKFMLAHKKYYNHPGTKNSKAKRLTWYLAKRTDNIKEQNERCLLKAFLCMEVKMMIFELELFKITHSQYVTFDKQKMIDIMNTDLIFFEILFKNYDQDSNYILGRSYEELEEFLDQMYSDDKLYYESLKSNETPFYIIILYWIYFLLNDSKKELSIFHYAKKKQMDGFVKWMPPKNAKTITHMFNSLCDKRGMPDLEKILQKQRIEHNRLLRYNVTNSMICFFAILWMMRHILRQIPIYDPVYKKLAKKMKKRLPEFVIS